MWDEVEYVELRNLTDQPVPLAGWQLLEWRPGGTAEKVLVEFTQEDEIEAQGYFLVEKREEASEVPADKIAGKLTLLNTGTQLRLRDAQGQLVDMANHRASGWLAGENTSEGVAMMRRDPPGEGDKAESWFSATEKQNGRYGTPRAANEPPPQDGEDKDELGDDTEGEEGEAIEEEIITSGKVRLNEIFPDPAGSDAEGEFIELINLDEREVNLRGWKLDDGEGGSRPYFFAEDTILAPGALLSLPRTQTGIAWNNAQDRARLYDAGGTLVDETSYVQAPTGSAWARNEEGEWSWTTTPTPGQPNQFTAAEETEEEEWEEETETASTKAKAEKQKKEKYRRVSLEQLSRLPLRSLVEVEGSVIAPPGVLGESKMYLANPRAGILIYFSRADWPELTLFEQVRVRGKLSRRSGERRILIYSRAVLQRLGKRKPFPPYRAAISEIHPRWVGRFLQMEGVVTKTRGRTFYLGQGGQTLRVTLAASAEIEKPDLPRGSKLRVRGILSRTRRGLRLLPRFDEDLEVLFRPQRAATGSRRRTRRRGTAFSLRQATSWTEPQTSETLAVKAPAPVAPPRVRLPEPKQPPPSPRSPSPLSLSGLLGAGIWLARRRIFF